MVQLLFKVLNSHVEEYDIVLLSKKGGGHAHDVSVGYSTEDLQLVLRLLSPYLHWKEFGCIALLSGLVKALIHCAISTP